jgi:hypothetical protein
MALGALETGDLEHGTAIRIDSTVRTRLDSVTRVQELSGSGLRNPTFERRPSEWPVYFGSRPTSTLNQV